MKKSVFYLLFLFIPNTFAAFMKKQYVVDIETVEACPNNLQLPIPLRNIKFLRYNRTHKALSYDFSYDRPLDENIGGMITLERWGDGGWISIPFFGYKANYCKTIGHFFKSVWVSFYAAAGVEHPDKCPIPAGNYSLKNFILDTSKLDNIIPFWSGRFRLTPMLKDSRTNEIIQCTIYIIKITELF